MIFGLTLSAPFSIARYVYSKYYRRVVTVVSGIEGRFPENNVWRKKSNQNFKSKSQGLAQSKKVEFRKKQIHNRNKSNTAT